MLKQILAAGLAALTLAAPVAANEGGAPWDPFPTERVTDLAALQRGARLFANYCLNCHSASAMRYNRLKDIGLTDAQIKDNLLFASDKVGDTMTVAMAPKDAKAWFGATPPDLSVIARSRAGAQGSGADYLYTYMRGFYRDDTRPTGWNNTVFPSVGMPHVLWELQGQMQPVVEEHKDAHDPSQVTLQITGFTPLTAGTLSAEQYNSAVADLVAYLQWMGEPGQNQRVRLGVVVMIFLAIGAFIAWRLNAAYWKDVT